MGKQTVFLLPETSGDLAKRAKLDFTHLGLSTLAGAAVGTAIAAAARAVGRALARGYKMCV